VSDDIVLILVCGKAIETKCNSKSAASMGSIGGFIADPNSHIG